MTFSPKPAPWASGYDECRAAQSPEAKSRQSFARSRRPDTHRGRHDPRASQLRASRVLRDLLNQNPGVEHFSVQRIVASIAHGGPAASLMLFSIPAIVPVPGTSDLVGPPAMAMSASLISGRALRLPPAILERSIPRRALALAIHAVLPVLERAEKVTRKRWSWLCTPAAHRVIGVLVFLLALPLTFPILGFGLPHATSLFTISLGMMEKDGVTIALGVTAGIASLVFFTAKGLSPQALAQKAADWLKRFASQMTLVREAAVAILKRALRWFTVTLLSGRANTPKRNAGGRPLVCLTSEVSATSPHRLVSAPLNAFVNESRLAPMAAV